MGFETYLVPQINKMHDLMIQAKVYPKQEGDKIIEAAVIGCETLRRLVDDPTFHRIIQQLSADRIDKQGSTTREFMNIVENSETFEAFLKIEYQVLNRGGLFPDITADLIYACRHAFEQVRDRAQPASEVIEAARRLQDQACRTADDLIKESKDTVWWDGVRDKVKRIIMGTGGAALAGLNAAAAIPTIATPVAPLTVALAAASGAFGGAIIQNAASTPKAKEAEG